MTRGTLFCIGKKGYVYKSREFNGDMYPSGYGDTVFSELKKVSTMKQFRTLIEEFNARHYAYSSGLHYKSAPETIRLRSTWASCPCIDITNCYFERFFSDWTFWLNLSEKPIIFRLHACRYTLLPGNAVRFNFDGFPEVDTYDELHQDLKEVFKDDLLQQ